MYKNDSDFGSVYHACENVAFEKFYRHDGYLFKENRLCVPKCSMHELLVREAHQGDLMGHFEIAKILDVLHEHFYFPNMKKDITEIYDNCIICKQTKSKLKPHSLYMPLLVPNSP